MRTVADGIAEQHGLSVEKARAIIFEVLTEEEVVEQLAAREHDYAPVAGDTLVVKAVYAVADLLMDRIKFRDEGGESDA